MNIIKIFRAVKSASSNQRLWVLITLSPNARLKLASRWFTRWERILGIPSSLNSVKACETFPLDDLSIFVVSIRRQIMMACSLSALAATANKSTESNPLKYIAVNYSLNFITLSCTQMQIT